MRCRASSKSKRNNLAIRSDRGPAEIRSGSRRANKTGHWSDARAFFDLVYLQPESYLARSLRPIDAPDVAPPTRMMDVEIGDLTVAKEALGQIA